jgi:hypothetical protein
MKATSGLYLTPILKLINSGDAELGFLTKESDAFIAIFTASANNP